MHLDYYINLILLGPCSALITFIVLRIFFRKSILFKVGLVASIFAVSVGILSSTPIEFGIYHFFWTAPTAVVLLVISFIYFTRVLKIPLERIRNVFNLLEEGDIKSVNKLDFNTKDEFADISDSASKLIDGFQDMSTFASEIGKGNLEVKFEPLGPNDQLGQSLITMQDSLKTAKIAEEKRKLEEERTAWANEGHAKFGDILRLGSDDKITFYNSIISNLVKYVGANQGGLFLLNDEDENDQHLELVAMYAFDRKKFISKRIEIGENLVGQCYLERESIFMTRVPNNYVTITSGLGDANPGCIFITPLLFNDNVYGIIELASFTVLEEYKRIFIQKLCEAIGSSISMYKVNMRTRKLLQDSKEKSEELASQEEEIRQNMEELQTTQEESSRREQEMNNFISALHNSFLIAELDLSGRVSTINHNYSRLIGFNQETIVGKQWLGFIKDNNTNFDELFDIMLQYNVFKREVTLVSNERIIETYVVITDGDGIPQKVLNMGLKLD